MARTLVEFAQEQNAMLKAARERGESKASIAELSRIGFAAFHEEHAQARLHGDPSPKIVCPQCQERGQVYVKAVKLKNGVSGGKVMGGLLTGGLSLLATGLSQKQSATEAHCKSCKSTWHF